MRASVVIPAYQAEATIGKTIESVLSQTHAVNEIIVADDGSTDNTVGVAEQLGAKVLRLQRGGPGQARNEAVQASEGDVIFFLDADDLWLPKKVEVHLEAHEAHRPPFVIDPCQRIGPDGSMRGFGAAGPAGPVGWKNFLDVGQWSCCSSISVNREDFLSVGGFLEELRFGEDIEVLWRLGYRKGDGYRVSDSLTQYIQSHGSLSRAKVPTEQYQLLLDSIPDQSPESIAELARRLKYRNMLFAKPGGFIGAGKDLFPGALFESELYVVALIRLLHFTRIRPM